MANTRDVLGDQETLDLLVRKQLTQLEENGINKINYNKFRDYKSLESVNFSNVTQIGSHCFQNCYYLKNVDIPSLKTLSSSAFLNCKSLNSIDLSNFNIQNSISSVFDGAGIGEIIFPPSYISISYNFFGYNYRISVIDINNGKVDKSSSVKNVYRLFHLLMRSENLENLTSNFSGTPLSSGFGWIYVPSDLVDEYKSATNWSNYAEQIVALDEYPKRLQDETITDSWQQIFAAERDGTYLTKYNLGDIKYVNIGGTNHPMQIVAFDTDELAEGNQTAKITWLSLCVFDTFYWDSSRSIVNWEESELRNWLRNVIYPQIESNVRNNIKPVIKTYYGYPLDTYSTVDTIWIPSVREMFGIQDKEKQGVKYTSFFTNSEVRVRKMYLRFDQPFNYPWLRSINDKISICRMSFTGSSVSSINVNSSDQHQAIILGFCT